jgi:alkanesulfonate monooxygenase SsuD/methylene tetrahydromethanopterin reductase-like flavin-dependent oxidoreductase (luciferase family)
MNSVPRPLRIGFKVSQARVTWGQLHAVWRHAGELGVFQSAWLFDHAYPVDGDGPCFEGMTALAALAPLVPGHQVGHLVLANPYRHPTLTAKSAATIDHISGGRFVLGLGAGWHVPETTAYGIPLDPIGQRLRDLRAAILVIRALLRPEAGVWPDDGADSSTAGGVSLEAPPYRLSHARNDPLPVQADRMPIWLGVQGEQVGLRIVAELADGWNYNAIFVSEEFDRKYDVLRRHADSVGRDIAGIEISAQMRVDRGQVPAARALAEHLVQAGVQHLVLYLDGREGPGMFDLVARELVTPLRDRFGGGPPSVA